MSLLRLLREHWAWWLVPLMITLAIVGYLAWAASRSEPAPMDYNLPGEL